MSTYATMARWGGRGEMARRQRQGLRFREYPPSADLIAARARNAATAAEAKARRARR